MIRPLQAADKSEVQRFDDDKKKKSPENPEDFIFNYIWLNR